MDLTEAERSARFFEKAKQKRALYKSKHSHSKARRPGDQGIKAFTKKVFHDYQASFPTLEPFASVEPLAPPPPNNYQASDQPNVEPPAAHLPNPTPNQEESNAGSREENPKEPSYSMVDGPPIVVRIELPLLKKRTSVSTCELCCTNNQLRFSHPLYKKGLSIVLLDPVDESRISSRFCRRTRVLEITCPLAADSERELPAKQQAEKQQAEKEAAELAVKEAAEKVEKEQAEKEALECEKKAVEQAKKEQAENVEVTPSLVTPSLVTPSSVEQGVPAKCTDAASASSEKRRGDLLFLKGELQAAQEAWATSLSLSSDKKLSADLLSGMAWCELKLGKNFAAAEAAESYSRRALDENPSCMKAYLRLYQALQRQCRWEEALGVIEGVIDGASAREEGCRSDRGLVKVLGQAKLDVLFQDYVRGLGAQESICPGICVREYPGKGNGINCTRTDGFSAGELIFTEPVSSAGVYARGDTSKTPLCAQCFSTMKMDGGKIDGGTKPAAIRCSYCNAQWCSDRCKQRHTSHPQICIGHCFVHEPVAKARARQSALKSLQDLGSDCWMTTQVWWGGTLYLFNAQWWGGTLCIVYLFTYSVGHIVSIHMLILFTFGLIGWHHTTTTCAHNAGNSGARSHR
jgi:tetratricopeptide (TPR) repeat protein